jgi:hypothetical protein
VLVVYAMHQEFWNWNKAEPLLFGLLPIGLAYHAAPSVAAALLMGVFVNFAWPAHLDQVEPYPEDNETEAKR